MFILNFNIISSIHIRIICEIQSTVLYCTWYNFHRHGRPSMAFLYSRNYYYYIAFSYVQTLLVLFMYTLLQVNETSQVFI